MGLFGNKGKEVVITGTLCRICGMNFAATDRLMRHMVKAHGKAKRTQALVVQIANFQENYLS